MEQDMYITLCYCDVITIVKPGATAAGRRAWFLIITFVRECMRVCVCMCVRPRGHKLLVA